MSEEVFHAARGALAAIAAGLIARGGEGVEQVLERLGEQDLSRAAFTPPAPCRLPACRHLPEAVAETLVLDSALAASVAALEDALHWRQTASYSDAAMGQAGFMDNYGHAEIVGPTGCFPGDDFLLGFLVLGPGFHYLDHHHPAPELYWVLSGASHWKRGDEGFVERRAGETVWHAPNVVHATRTLADPLLTVWAWTRDVSTPARLIADQSSPRRQAR